MTMLSLSEVEAMALKAARGAGFDWGLAEEAAFAARWLEGQGIAGLTLLAAHLDRMDRVSRPVLTMTGRLWASTGTEPLCPIVVGAALNDHFDLPEGAAQGPVQLTDVACPALLLPALANAAARSGAAVLVDWGSTQVVVSDRVLLTVTGAEGLLAERAPRVSLAVARPSALAPLRHALSAETSGILDRLIWRTYVPASDQSRRDAGAAGRDDI